MTRCGSEDGNKIRSPSLTAIIFLVLFFLNSFKSEYLLLTSSSPALEKNDKLFFF